jgi:hypothetical protein
MRWIRPFVLLALLSGTWCFGESVDPDLNRLLREAQKPKVHYGPARVGWNGPETPSAQRTLNATYESLRWDSPAAIRRELRGIVVPQWQIVLALLTMILGLRLARNNRPTLASDAPGGEVLSFPSPSLPRQEAA